MNKFAKKVLARYVKYVEIIGYLFVIMFIGCLIALSFIKAEDEFVNLTGKYEIDNFKIKFDQPGFIIDFRANENASVVVKQALIEFTKDKKFITDQKILINLDEQLEEARKVSETNLEKKLKSIIFELEEKAYPDLKISVLKTPVAGKFLLPEYKTDFIPANTSIGGVFNFASSFIRVTNLPTDKRIRAKIAKRQTGTANVKIDDTTSISLSVIIDKVDENEIIIKFERLTEKQEILLAKKILKLTDDSSVDITANILIGWKSWMSLIWR